MLTLTNDNIDTKEIPISLEHLMIVYFTVYRLISSVTAVKSIGSAKPGKARVINFKARAKPKARALEKGGLFSITTFTFRNYLYGQFLVVHGSFNTEALSGSIDGTFFTGYLRFVKKTLRRE